MPDYRHEDELAALLSPRVRAEIERQGIQRIAFSDLWEGEDWRDSPDGMPSVEA